MKTQFIRVMSDKERNNAAQKAIESHESITLRLYAPIGTIMCCPGVIPLVKFGGGTIYTVMCPLCGFKRSWWGTEDSIGRMWNEVVGRDRSFNPVVGRDYLSDYPDDSIYRIRLDCVGTYMFWGMINGWESYEKITNNRMVAL